MGAKPITEKQKKRCAELIGMGLTRDEVGGAVGIGDGSVGRIMADPVYRKMADDITKQRVGVGAQAAGVILDLMNATDKDGHPALHLRKIGAELYAKNPVLVEQALDDTGDDLLPGVVLRFPAPPGVGQHAATAPQE